MHFYHTKWCFYTGRTKQRTAPPRGGPWTRHQPLCLPYLNSHADVLFFKILSYDFECSAKFTFIHANVKKLRMQSAGLFLSTVLCHGARVEECAPTMQNVFYQCKILLKPLKCQSLPKAGVCHNVVWRASLCVLRVLFLAQTYRFRFASVFFSFISVK